MKQYLGDAHFFKPIAVREKQNTEFYGPKMVSALKELLDAVLEDSKKDSEDEETKTWRTLRARAKRILREIPRLNVITPDIEAELLGSATGLAATADFVEYDMAKRTTQSRTIRK